MSEIPEDVMASAREIAVYISGGSLRDNARLIAQAILAERQSDKWQPIETAPKDGTRVLSFSPDELPDEQISTARCTAAGELVHECCVESTRWDDYDHGRWEPTHWMPLPTKPRQVEAAQS